MTSTPPGDPLSDPAPNSKAESTPAIRTARRCGNCGEHVTALFIRVLGIKGSVQACPRCTTSESLYDGAAVERDRRRFL